jgi:hypothetical protein
MRKIVRLTESDLTRLVRRVIKEQNEPSSEVNKKGIIDLLVKNGFEFQSQFSTPTYTKVIPNKGEFAVVVMSSDPIVNFYVKNPSADIVKSLFLKPLGEGGYYTDNEGLINKGWEYYVLFAKDKSVEQSPAYKQISWYISRIK